MEINLGGADIRQPKPVLGLTDAELDRVTASTIAIGDLSSGTVTVSADITRPARTDVRLESSKGIVDSAKINAAGGTVRVNANGSLTDGTFIDREGLRFFTDGTFTNDSTQATVHIGFTPAAGANFKPQLSLPSGVALTKDGTGKWVISTAGKVTAFAGAKTLDLFRGTIDGDSTRRVAIPVQALLAGGFEIDSKQAIKTAVNVDISYTPNRLLLKAQGDSPEVGVNIGFRVLGGAGVRLQGNNRLVGTANGFTQNIASGSLPFFPAPNDANGKPTSANFSFSGLAFQANTLSASYDSATDKRESRRPQGTCFRRNRV